MVEGVAAGMLSGSSAKLQAMAAGEVPPGADVVAVAGRWLDDPRVGWSCWATATMAAAVATACGRDAAVLATRRVDAAAVAVDFHAMVVVDDDDGRWVADPYFGVPAIPAAGGAARRPGVEGEAAARAHGWELVVRSEAVSHELRYRSLTGPLRPDDVEAFCRVSVTHTGVPPRPFASRLLADGLASAKPADGGGAVVRRWRVAPGQAPGAEPTSRHTADWDAAVSVLLSL